MSNSGQAQEPTMEEILASIRRIISEDSGEEGDAGPEAAPEAPPPASEPEESFELEEEGEVLELTDALPEEPAASAQEPSFVEEPAPAPEPEPAAYSAGAAEIEEEAPAEAPAETPTETNVVEPAFSPPAEAADAVDDAEIEPEIEEKAGIADLEPSDFIEDDASEEETFDADDDIVFEELSEEQEPVMSAENAEPLLSEAANSNLMSRVTEDAASAAFGALSSSLVTSTGDARTLEELVGELLKPMLKDWLDANLPSMVEEMVREEIERVARKRR